MVPIGIAYPLHHQMTNDSSSIYNQLINSTEQPTTAHQVQVGFYNQTTHQSNVSIDSTFINATALVNSSAHAGLGSQKKSSVSFNSQGNFIDINSSKIISNSAITSNIQAINVTGQSPNELKSISNPIVNNATVALSNSSS